MEYQIEELSLSRRRANFQVADRQVSKELDKAYSFIKNSFNMPGFRKGRVPINIIRSRFGARVRGDVVKTFINEGWQKIVAELAPVGEPEVDHDELASGQPFTFSLTFDVTPEITVSDYIGIDVPFPEVTVPDDLLDMQVAKRLETISRIVELPEDQEAASDHIVFTQLRLLDGENELRYEEGTSIRIDQEPYYPGLDQILKGMKPGEEKQQKVKISSDSPLGDIAGKVLEAQVKVLSVRASQAPELSDESARELGFEGGQQGMLAAIHEELRATIEQYARDQAKNALLTKLVETHDFEIPEPLIQEQLKAVLDEASMLHAYRGNDPRTFDQSQKAMDDYRKRAIFGKKASLILLGIAKQENIEVTGQDMQDTYQKIADERDQSLEAIKGYFEKDNAVQLLKERILEQKTLDWLLERANLVSVQPDEGPQTTAAPDAQEQGETAITDEEQNTDPIQGVQD